MPCTFEYRAARRAGEVPLLLAVALVTLACSGSPHPEAPAMEGAPDRAVMAPAHPDDTFPAMEAGRAGMSEGMASRGPAMGMAGARDGAGMAGGGNDAMALASAVRTIREATAAFRSIDAAVAAGYSADGGGCIDNPTMGAMGYHHMNAALLDDVLELERPEILTYERTADGGYELTGVEYVVPLDAWTRDEPPVILGEPLRRAPSLGIWYLHVWVWRDNPDGLFADWNPAVSCRV